MVTQQYLQQMIYYKHYNENKTYLQCLVELSSELQIPAHKVLIDLDNSAKINILQEIKNLIS